MYRKSAVQCEQLFGSVAYIVNIRCVRHLKQILLICSSACVVGNTSTFEWENACANHCFNWNLGKISHFGQCM